MEYPDPDHVDPHLTSQEPAYPDINESIHYPWQGEEQPAQTEESLHSVIDPRLYKDLFSASASQLPDQPLEGDDDEAERFAEELYPRVDDSAEDENYEYPGEESSEYAFNGCALVLNHVWLTVNAGKMGLMIC